MTRNKETPDERVRRLHPEGDPLANADRLRAIADLNPGSRINIDKAWALKIADQLEGLVEHAESFGLSGEEVRNVFVQPDETTEAGARG